MRWISRLAVVISSLLVVPTADAQWLNHPTPNLPRTADGKPDLAAPPPRGADGRRDRTDQTGAAAAAQAIPATAHTRSALPGRRWGSSISRVTHQ